MQELIVSLHKNSLRISTIEKNNFKTATSVLTDSQATNTHINSVDEFSSHLLEQIRLLTKTSKKNLSLNIVLEAQNTITKFVTVNKRDGEPGEQIIADVKSRLDGVTLDELYFGYEKIAPFLYQFSAVKKDILDKWIEVSNLLGIELRSMVPWIMALPKFQKVNDPAIFITKRGDEQVVVLSELNGVFFTGVYAEERSLEEIKQLVTELSLYKRTQPIKNVYVFDYEGLDLGTDYKVTKMDLPQIDSLNEVGYSQNILVNYMLDEEIDIFTSLNFVNLLPLPVVEKNMAVQVYVKPALAITTLGLLAFGTFTVLRPYIYNARASDPNVLSERTEVKETTQSTPSAPVPTPVVTPQPTPVAEAKNRSELKLRIENAAGISGLAAKSRDYLKEMGYTVTEIDTASTLSSTTQVKIKTSKGSYKDLLLQDMKTKFGTVTISENLPENSPNDVLVLLGPEVKL